MRHIMYLLLTMATVYFRYDIYFIFLIKFKIFVERTIPQINCTTLTDDYLIIKRGISNQFENIIIIEK